MRGTKLLSKHKGRGLEHEIFNAHVSFTMPDHCSAAEVIEKIAEHCNRTVSSIPERLRSKSIRDLGGKWGRGSQGSSLILVHGAAREKLEDLTRHEDVRVTISKQSITLEEVRIAFLDTFASTVGRLMYLLKHEGRRIPEAQYLWVLSEIDKRKYSPERHLEGVWRHKLKEHNLLFPPAKRIKTFTAAYLNPKLRRGVSRTLSRAKEEFLKRTELSEPM